MNNVEPLQLLETLWKRRRWVLPPLIVGIAISVVAVKMASPRYQARTLVMVEPQKVPSDYVKSTVTSDLKDRLKTLEQQVMTRVTLETLVDEINLFPEMQGQVTKDQMIAMARRSLMVKQMIRGKVFEISFRASEPEAAAAAANRVAELFMEENLNLRERQAENTSKFLGGQLEDMKGDLEILEHELASYRLRHAGSLPEQRQTNLAAIANLERRLEINQAAIKQAELKALILQQSPDEFVPELLPGTESDSKLQQLEEELASLRRSFTDLHPDVIRVKKEIDQLIQNQGRLEIDQEDLGPETTESPMEMEIEGIETQLVQLSEERLKLVDEIGMYQRRLENTPRIEQELFRLTRDYQNSLESYQDLRSKEIQAQLAEDLEREQQSEQFRLLELARAPSSPYYPNRFLFLGAGIMLGLGVGVGLALIRDGVDSTFKTLDEVQRQYPAVKFVISVPRLKVGTTSKEQLADADDARRSA